MLWVGKADDLTQTLLPEKHFVNNLRL